MSNQQHSHLVDNLLNKEGCLFFISIAEDVTSQVNIDNRRGLTEYIKVDSYSYDFLVNCEASAWR